jgi:formylglycine-generating enzyme
MNKITYFIAFLNSIAFCLNAQTIVDTSKVQEFQLLNGQVILVNDNGTWHPKSYEKRNNQEIRLDDGKVIVLSSEGKWAYKVYKKPKIEWAVIPAGTFTMGGSSRNEGTNKHRVTLSSFKISKYEVTIRQYAMFCDATNRIKPKNEENGNLPIVGVSWEDANAFALWVGCRLPTEAEWEYACHGGGNTKYSTGTTINRSQANIEYGMWHGDYKPVGSYAPNAYGIYDMHGNAEEWCSDFASNEYPKEAQIDPKGPTTHQDFTITEHIHRGGDVHDGDAESCGCTHRSDLGGAFGFRLASDL